MASGPTIFDVRGASKHFGGIAALSHVGFEVRAGEVLGLIGPNGAGKTLRTPCRLQRPAHDPRSGSPSEQSAPQRRCDATDCSSSWRPDVKVGSYALAAFRHERHSRTDTESVTQGL